ncbi:hypothetical protein [Microbacterium sp. NIBRBAC000506063]|uniref:hypothetical protein n=1 Tax=Microbacterium sp. NIBRBAC000506063 TaxID=2734618 RepID=UPI001BB5FB8B|nr:hypothetical protein [Microbacterium sp. NIBRBAC000506063]QTV79617.1 hypothetical protein KAE78_12395 [Microbacterium sp. NIBRBAC000506063]
MADSAEKKTTTTEKKWVATEGAKSQAKSKRIIALILWAIAIALEAVGIFWLLRQREFVGEDGTFVRDQETGLLEQQNATAVFPTWAFVTLIVLLVVIAALAITGSLLWKKANALDPASKEDKVRFFVQNQLGAIIAIIAFLPLVLLIFLNKDMSGTQKGVAGGVGIVLALVAAYFGASFSPPRSSSTRPTSRPSSSSSAKTMSTGSPAAASTTSAKTSPISRPAARSTAAPPPKQSKPARTDSRCASPLNCRHAV